MRRKAISLKQPWANLVCSGKKTIETRKWNTKYRGDLVICSSQQPKIEPYGKALCFVEVYHTEPMKKKHEKKACIKVYPRAWAWHLKNTRLLKKPVPIKGQLSIYEIDLPY
ncbi:MAG: ASCH domain-containing protein [Parcubacteria group bacterium]|nr:ASCH domain-containing protein [Parcubacteria group bacterium]